VQDLVEGGLAPKPFALCQNFAGGRFSAGIHHGTCRDLSGGFTTHMPAHESTCFPIPSDVTFEEAALPDPFSVCPHAVQGTA
jgi:threonine dehydrogenase-like Zn-dependent dehydrogenase